VPSRLVFPQCAGASQSSTPSSRYPLGSDIFSIVTNTSRSISIESIDTSLVIWCVSWLCTGAETAWFFTRDACGPYEHRCPILWHSEHVGFSPGQRAFFRLSRWHIRNRESIGYPDHLGFGNFFFFYRGLGTYRQGPQACRVRFKETLCMV
jgi:hypothetical protein